MSMVDYKKITNAKYSHDSINYLENYKNMNQIANQYPNCLWFLTYK